MPSTTILRLGATRVWIWVALRTLQPAAVGLLAAVLLLGNATKAAWALTALGLMLGCLLGVALCLRPDPGHESPYPTPWLSYRSALLGMAALLAALASGLGQSHAASPLADVALVAGLSVLVLTGLGDRFRGHGLQRHYAIALFPWFSALRLGLLGSWLLTFGRPAFTVLDQRLLSLVIFLLVLDLLIFMRWESSMALGGGEHRAILPQLRTRFSLIVLLRAWGGGIAPAVLVLLTATGEGVLLGAIAWLLSLLGDGLWYYALTALRRPASSHLAEAKAAPVG